MIDIINQVSRFRHQLGLSQTDFADRFGLPFQTYAQWERRHRKPDVAATLLLVMIVNTPETVERVVKQQRFRLAQPASTMGLRAVI